MGLVCLKLHTPSLFHVCQFPVRDCRTCANQHAFCRKGTGLNWMWLKIQLDPTRFNCVVMIILLKSSKSHPTLQEVSLAPGGQIFSVSKLPNTNQHLKGSRSLHKPRNFTGKYYSVRDKEQLNKDFIVGKTKRGTRAFPMT